MPKALPSFTFRYRTFFVDPQRVAPNNQIAMRGLIEFIRLTDGTHRGIRWYYLKRATSFFAEGLTWLSYFVMGFSSLLFMGFLSIFGVHGGSEAPPEDFNVSDDFDLFKNFDCVFTQRMQSAVSKDERVYLCTLYALVCLIPFHKLEPLITTKSGRTISQYLLDTLRTTYLSEARDNFDQQEILIHVFKFLQTTELSFDFRLTPAAPSLLELTEELCTAPCPKFHLIQEQNNRYTQEQGRARAHIDSLKLVSYIDLHTTRDTAFPKEATVRV